MSSLTTNIVDSLSQQQQQQQQALLAPSSVYLAQDASSQTINVLQPHHQTAPSTVQHRTNLIGATSSSIPLSAEPSSSLVQDTTGADVSLRRLEYLQHHHQHRALSSDAAVVVSDEQRQQQQHHRPRFTRSQSTKEVIKNYIKKETANFFGVSLETEEEQAQVWRERRLRLASRAYGELKDEYTVPYGRQTRRPRTFGGGTYLN